MKLQAMKLRPFRAPEKVWRDVGKAAKREGISQAEFIRRAVVAALANRQVEQ